MDAGGIMGQRLRSFVRRLSLAQRFGLASLVILILGLVGIGFWVQRQIGMGIIHGTAATTALYVAELCRAGAWRAC